MDIKDLIETMTLDRTFAQFVNDPVLQFGPQGRVYLGPTLLPERTVTENQFTETSVSYRTIIANDGTRYGPSQIKRGEIVGEVDVKLAEQDLAREFSGRDYDAWRKLFKGSSMAAVVGLTQWVDRTLVRGMLDKQELQRFQAIVTGTVPLRGDNSYRDSMTYSNPSGHRTVASAAFTDGTTDPMDMFVGQKTFMATKGYALRRIIMSTQALMALAGNAKIKARVGGAVINTSGTIIGVSGIVDTERLNSLFIANGLPAPETYDLQYRTQTTVAPFLPIDAVIFVASTERDEAIDLGDTMEVVSGVIGYHAIGVAVGQDDPGRVMNVQAFVNKPPRIEGEIFQTSCPVILEPEAFTVVTGVI